MAETDFKPVKTPIGEFPFLPGSTVRGLYFSLYTVVDRGGFAFVSCCIRHEHDGTASGFPPASLHGELLAVFEAVDGRLESCGRDGGPVVLTGEQDGGVQS